MLQPRETCPSCNRPIELAITHKSLAAAFAMRVPSTSSAKGLDDVNAHPTASMCQGGFATFRTGGTLKVLFGLPLRQTVGLVESLIQMAGLDWPVPDYSTLCRRQARIAVHAEGALLRDHAHGDHGEHRIDPVFRLGRRHPSGGDAAQLVLPALASAASRQRSTARPSHAPSSIGVAWKAARTG